MTFSVPHTTPDGRRVMLDSDVLDISRRLQEGDATLGWIGDPNLSLDLDQATDTFIVVWHDPQTGADLDVCRYPAPLDAGLLIKLREADTRRRGGNDPVADMLAAEEKAEADAEAEFDDFVREEVAPRMTHAMRKDHVRDVPAGPTYFSERKKPEGS